MKIRFSILLYGLLMVLLSATNLNAARIDYTAERIVGVYSNSTNLTYTLDNTHARTISEFQYYSNELGGPMTIHNIGLVIVNMLSVTQGSIFPIQIYMKNTTDSLLDVTSQGVGGWAEPNYASDYTLVFSSNDMSVTTASYQNIYNIALSQPFTYTGGNLNVVFVRPSGVSTATIGYNWAATNISAVTTDANLSVGRYKYGAAVGLWTAGKLTYRPVMTFNNLTPSREHNMVTGVVSNLRLVTENRISAIMSPNSTPSANSNYWISRYPVSYINQIYSPSEMGNGLLPTCPRTINEMSLFITAKPGSTSITDTQHIAIYMRNLPSATEWNNGTNPSTYSTSTGFVKVYEGTYTVARSIGWVTFNIGTKDSPFIYNGTSSLEVLIKSNSNTELPTYNTFADFGLNSGNTEARAAYSTTTTAPTTWNSTPIQTRKLAARFAYTPDIMRISSIKAEHPVNNFLSDTLYNLMRVNIKTENTCNPITLNNLNIDLTTSPNAAYKYFKVYYTNNQSPNFQDTIYIGTIQQADLISNVSDLEIPINRTLLQGDNYFYVVGEMDLSSDCMSPLDITLTSIYADDLRYSNITMDLSNSIFPQLTQPVLINQGDYPMCATSETRDYTIETLGTIRTLNWEIWNPETNMYEAVEGNHTNTITLNRDNILAGKNKMRLIAIPAAGDCFYIDTLTISPRITTPVSNAQFTANGITLDPVNPASYCMDDEITMIGTFEGNAFEVQWQYLDNDMVWKNIPITEIPSANADTMYFIPYEYLRNIQNTKIRFAAISESECGSSIAYSEEYPIKVFRSNKFVQQPRSIASLCDGERLYAVAMYDGEEAIEKGWYKNDYPINYDNPVLDIQNVTIQDAGYYYYRVVAEGCINEIISDTMFVFINKDPQVIDVMSKVRANLGQAAVLRVDSRYAENEDTTGRFQWYRHYAVTNRDIAVKEGGAFYGTKSNKLCVTPTSEEEYTYNGDYYFCCLKARCGGAYSSCGSPIYLIDAYTISITKHPDSIRVCLSDNPTATFTFEAMGYADTATIMYQWYADGVSIVDNAIYTGSKTPTLSYTPGHLSPPYPTFTCKLWIAGRDPNVHFEMTNPAAMFVDAPLPIIPNDTTFDLVVGDNFLFGLYRNDIGVFMQWRMGADNDTTKVKLLEIDANTTEIIDVVCHFTNLSGNTKVIGGALLDEVGEYYVADLTPVKTEYAGTYYVVILSCGGESHYTFDVNVAAQPPVTGVQEEIEKSLLISPNPAKENVSLKFQSVEGKNYTLNIMDETGSIVYTTMGLTERHNNINVDLLKNKFANGTYIASINIDGKSINKRFVIVK